jgi:hypothetical protein
VKYRIWSIEDIYYFFKNSPLHATSSEEAGNKRVQPQMSGRGDGIGMV